MTKDDIIKLALEAGLFTHKEVQPELLAFAALVAEREREIGFAKAELWIKRINDAVLAEREACAAMFDDRNVWDEEVGERIRARRTT